MDRETKSRDDETNSRDDETKSRDDETKSRDDETKSRDDETKRETLINKASKLTLELEELKKKIIDETYYMSRVMELKDFFINFSLLNEPNNIALKTIMSINIEDYLPIKIVGFELENDGPFIKTKINISLMDVDDDNKNQDDLYEINRIERYTDNDETLMYMTIQEEKLENILPFIDKFKMINLLVKYPENISQILDEDILNDLFDGIYEYRDNGIVIIIDCEQLIKNVGG